MVRNRSKGLFITLEGIEGSGKSSHSRRLCTWLEDTGRSCLLTHEPGGTPVGEVIRKVLLNPATGELDPLTEVFLFEAARREHVSKVIRPAIEQGKIVLCVRYTDSTIAYQGYGRGLPVSILQALNEIATGGLEPDLTLFLDVEPEEGLKRSLSHTEDGELRFEREFVMKKELLTQIREGFHQLCRQHPQRFVQISTMNDRKKVFEEITRLLAVTIGVGGTE